MLLVYVTGQKKVTSLERTEGALLVLVVNKERGGDTNASDSTHT